MTNFQRAVKDITRKKQRQPGYAGTTTIPRILRLFWISNKSPLKSSHPKKYFLNFPTQNKIPESKISNLRQKSFDHPRHLNSGVPTPPPPYWGFNKPCSKDILLIKTHKPNNNTGKWILKMFYSPFRSFEQLLTSIGIPRSWPLFKFQKC